MRILVDRRFGGPDDPAPALSDEPFPVPVEATERDGIVTIKAAVPGVACRDILVELRPLCLTIRSHPACPGGHFLRTVTLPSDLEICRAKTGVRNGFVYVKIPKCSSRHAQA